MLGPRPCYCKDGRGVVIRLKAGSKNSSASSYCLVGWSVTIVSLGDPEVFTNPYSGGSKKNNQTPARTKVTDQLGAASVISGLIDCERLTQNNLKIVFSRFGAQECVSMPASYFCKWRPFLGPRLSKISRYSTRNHYTLKGRLMIARISMPDPPHVEKV